LEASTFQEGRDQQLLFREFGEQYFAPRGDTVQLAGEWLADSGLVLSLEQDSTGVAGNWRGTQVSVRGDARNHAVKLTSSVGGQAFGVIAEDGSTMRLLAVKDGKNSVVSLSRPA